MSNLAEFLLGNLSFAYAFRSVIKLNCVNRCIQLYTVPLCLFPVVDLTELLSATYVFLR
jgi:hypothetical protein